MIHKEQDEKLIFSFDETKAGIFRAVEEQKINDKTHPISMALAKALQENKGIQRFLELVPQEVLTAYLKNPEEDSDDLILAIILIYIFNNDRFFIEKIKDGQISMSEEDFKKEIDILFIYEDLRRKGFVEVKFVTDTWDKKLMQVRVTYTPEECFKSICTKLITRKQLYMLGSLYPFEDFKTGVLKAMEEIIKTIEKQSHNG